MPRFILPFTFLFAFFLSCSPAAAQSALAEWSTGSSQHYFPTTTGKYSIIDTGDIDPATYGDGVFYIDLEILATGYWPGQAGFTYGVAGYPLANTVFHELGQYADEWAYRGRSGQTYTEGTVFSFGRIVNQIGDKIRIWYDSRTGELRIYTMLVSESDWTLEGSGVASTDVVPEAGRVLRFAAAGICWQTCGVKIVGSGVPPKAADATVTLEGGAPYTFTAADFNFDDQGDGGALNRIQVATLPASGTLFLDANADNVIDDGEAVTDGAEVSKADLDAGRFKFRPDVAEAAAFTFKVHDGIAYTTDAYTMTVDATSLPVELTTFTATADGDGVVLRWATASETNNAGFSVELRAGDARAWREVAFVSGHGTTSEAQRYEYRAEGLMPGTHRFRLHQVDFDGAFDYSPEIELTIEASGLSLALYGVPARETLRGTLAGTGADGARVTLYDMMGRQVAAQEVTPGALALDVSALAAGSYVLRVEAGPKSLTRRFVVVR